jgi:hypothetical protein
MCRLALFSGGQHSRLDSKSSTAKRLGQTLAVEEHHASSFLLLCSMTCFSETFGMSLPTVSIALRRVDFLRRDVDHRSRADVARKRRCPGRGRVAWRL